MGSANKSDSDGEAITTPAAAGGGGLASPQHTCEGKPDVKQGDPGQSASMTMVSAGVSGPSGGITAEGAERKVEQRFMRSFPAHLRHAVIRGLVTGGEYAFRVLAINSAGRGEPGPWTEIVRVVDPADEMD